MQTQKLKMSNYLTEGKKPALPEAQVMANSTKWGRSVMFLCVIRRQLLLEEQSTEVWQAFKGRPGIPN